MPVNFFVSFMELSFTNHLIYILRQFCFALFELISAEQKFETKPWLWNKENMKMIVYIRFKIYLYDKQFSNEFLHRIYHLCSYKRCQTLKYRRTILTELPRLLVSVIRSKKISLSLIIVHSSILFITDSYSGPSLSRTPSISNFFLSRTIFSVLFHWFQPNFFSLSRTLSV